MQKHLVAVAVGALAATNLFAAPVVVQSPDGQVAASFDAEDGELFYSVSKSGKPVVGSSKVEIFGGAKMAVLLARGGFEVDLAWAKGHLTQARVRATQDGVFRIYSEGRLSKDITLKRGQSLTWPKNT